MISRTLSKLIGYFGILTLILTPFSALNAFNDDVHFGLTYRIGRLAGLEHYDALTIAAGDRGVDYDPHDQPAANIFQSSTPEKPISNLHFLFPKVAEANITMAIARVTGNPGSEERESSLWKVGNAFHSLQDTYSHPHTGTKHKEGEVDLTSFNPPITWMMAKHTLYEMLCVRGRLQEKPVDNAVYLSLIEKMEGDPTFHEFFMAETASQKTTALNNWGVTSKIVAEGNKSVWRNVSRKRGWLKSRVKSGLGIGASASIMALPIPGARIVGGILTGILAAREIWKFFYNRDHLSKNGEKADLNFGSVVNDNKKPVSTGWKERAHAFWNYFKKEDNPEFKGQLGLMASASLQAKIIMDEHRRGEELKRAESSKLFFEDFLQEKRLTKLKMFSQSESTILQDAYQRGSEFEKSIYKFGAGKVKFSWSNMKYVPWVVSGGIASIGKIISFQLSLAAAQTVGFIKSIPERIKGGDYRSSKLKKQEEEGPAVTFNPSMAATEFANPTDASEVTLPGNGEVIAPTGANLQAPGDLVGFQQVHNEMQQAQAKYLEYLQLPAANQDSGEKEALYRQFLNARQKFLRGAGGN